MPAATFTIDTEEFLAKALHWADVFDAACLLHSNGFQDPHAGLDSLLAVGIRDEFVADGSHTFEKIAHFKTRYPNEWVLGFFSYDLKNEIEDLTSNQPDNLGFPDAYFFLPQIVLQFQSGSVSIHTHGELDAEAIFQEINSRSVTLEESASGAITLDKPFRKRMSKSDYTEAFHQLQGHIQRGDIYEVNLCQEFYAESVDVDPCSIYQHLNCVSPMPFSCFFKLQDHHILCASPERFLAKRGEQLISQPIKGTAPRGGNSQEDEEIIKRLLQNPKERAENVMIVDLVRNDLTRSAVPASVDASRVLEVHTFPQVHQLISTVTCIKDPDTSDITAIRNTFPAGSMTGAPKIKAMQLCDSYEGSKRGIYAGALGYFSPNGDFDFNVVIRSILYNKKSKRLSFHTGGAITQEAEAEHEYAECLLKASAILRTLSASLS